MKKFTQILSIIFSLTSIRIVQCTEATSLKDEHTEHQNIKVLVLIIANDDPPIYEELQRLWKSYMHLDREHVEAYFIKGNPNLQKPFEILDDVLWTKTAENFIPGILNKTLLSFETMLPRIKNEFDYVLRTNLSSFYVFPRLLKFLETLPKKRCYCAVIGETTPGIRFGSGAGFILSSDLIELMLKKKRKLFDSTWHHDDVVIGKFFQDEQISIIPAPRIDFYSLAEWCNYQRAFTDLSGRVTNEKILDKVFHVRVKQKYEQYRLAEDIPIYSDLVKLFYDGQ